jgi:hypothetical protein
MNPLLTEHKQYFLDDGRGQVWNFYVHPVTETVIVQSPVITTGEPCSMLYHKTFLRKTLEGLPQGAAMRLFSEARVFSRDYRPVVKPFEQEDWTRDTFEVGVRIRFTREHPSVVMEREDARRLWELLRTAR